MGTSASQNADSTGKIITGVQKAWTIVTKITVMRTGTTAALTSTILGTTTNAKSHVVRKEQATTGVIRKAAAGNTALHHLSWVFM